MPCAGRIALNLMANEVAETIYPDGQKPTNFGQDQQDVENCRLEVMQVLQKYGCDIAVGILITGEGNKPDVQIVKK